MRAFVMTGIGSAGIVEKPVPRPGARDAVVRTTAALFCTSDVHTVAGGLGDLTNLTLGHEAVGVIVEVGPEVRDFKPGDRVLAGAVNPNWSDLLSQSGHPSQSALGDWRSPKLRDGVLAEFFAVSDADANLAHIPPGVPDEKAVYCADMISTGFAAAERANIPLGGTVAVFAEGPVGLMATLGASLLGAAFIIGVEGVHERQELARHFGAHAIVDPGADPVVEAILRLTGGEGVDCAIEALGRETTLSAAIEVTKPGGTIVNAGYHSSGDTIGIPRIGWGAGMAEKTIASVLCPGGRLRLQRLLRLVESGRVDPTPLTTHVFSPETMLDAFELMRTKGDNVIKPLVKFDEARLPRAEEHERLAAAR